MVASMNRVCFFQDGFADDPTIDANQFVSDENVIDSEVDLSAAADSLAQHVVRVEANFLRLPLFTLDNKHMRTMDGLRCEGTFRRGGKSFTFSYSVTRNTATYYPGPLARAAHFSLLSIATD